MGFIGRAIKRGVSDAVGKAIGNAVTKAVEPKATELTNRVANSIDRATVSAEQQVVRASGLEGAMANLERSAQGYVTDAARNMKICPSCNRPTSAEKKFCPDCGAMLPEQTVAQGAVCISCGTQNAIGTKFCTECGAMLPAAIQEEQAKAERNASVMAQWDSCLPHYPKWTCSECEIDIEEYEAGCFELRADFNKNEGAAHRAVNEYREILLQNGFRKAGEYPCIEHLYKMVDGVCYHADTSMCFEASSDCPSIAFNISEPHGGYNYIKPEPKKKVGLMDLFK